MLKSIVLVAAFAISAQAYIMGPARERIANDFEIASIEMDDVRAKYGMRTLQAHNPALDGLIVGDWTEVDILADSFNFFKGFAYGLQFTPNKAGQCYYAVEQSISSAETIKNLLLQAYLPWVWSDIMRIANNYVAFFAAVNTYCNVQKLIKTVTTDPGTFFPAAVSRLGGGFILEIPAIYMKMKSSGSAFEIARNAAKLFSLLLDYYI
jgi:hypothetical protein